MVAKGIRCHTSRQLSLPGAAIVVKPQGGSATVGSQGGLSSGFLEGPASSEQRGPLGQSALQAPSAIINTSPPVQTHAIQICEAMCGT